MYRLLSVPWASHLAQKCSSNAVNATLASNGEIKPPWGVPVAGSLTWPPSAMMPALRKALIRARDAFVPDPPAHPLKDRAVCQLVEARRDVRVQHPLVALGAEVDDLSDRVLGPPSRPEAVTDRLEVCLEDGLQHQRKRGLHQPV